MTQPGQPADESRGRVEKFIRDRSEQRKDRLRDDFRKNGQSIVPTWVLVLILVVIVGGFALAVALV